MQNLFPDKYNHFMTCYFILFSKMNIYIKVHYNTILFHSFISYKKNYIMDGMSTRLDSIACSSNILYLISMSFLLLYKVSLSLSLFLKNESNNNLKASFVWLHILHMCVSIKFDKNIFEIFQICIM